MSSKSTTKQRVQAIREFARRIVASEYANNISAAARTLRLPQSQLNDLLNGTRGLGLLGIERLADHAGTTLDEVVGRAPRAAGGGAALLRAHPQWLGAADAARRQHPEIEGRFFDQAGALCPAGGLPERIDVPFVAGLARELRGLAERVPRGRATTPDPPEELPPPGPDESGEVRRTILGRG